MRLIKIPNLEYETYGRIRSAIMQIIPFALINQDYDPKQKCGVFNFWDSDYIPDELKKFIVQPPLSRENRKLLQHDALADIADALL